MNIKKSITIAALACAAVVITGCASLPSPEAMKAATADYQLPKLPAAGEAMVYVVRPSSVGSMVRFNVFVDDQEPSSEMGFTRGNQYIYFTLPPGQHKIYSKAENWAETPVSVKAGDVVFIEQEPSMGVIMARNGLVKLDELPGKYHVKNLPVGTIIKTAK
jgi:hypothetical protein